MSQTVFLDGNEDGADQRRVDLGTAQLDAGCMAFQRTHEHWHFDSSADYALAAVDDEEPIVTRDEVSFCLRDSERLRGAARQEGGPAAFDDCARDRRQGITVGWADRYDLLTELDEEDNTSAVAIRIRGTEVARLTGRSC